MALQRTQVWEVVGGVDKGGIIVRTGSELGSTPAVERLSTGALVRQLEETDGRLHYELLTGSGPAKGWVSINLREKALLVERMEQPEVEHQAEVATEESKPQEVHTSDESTSDSDRDATSDSGSGSDSLEDKHEALPAEDRKAPEIKEAEAQDPKEALRHYAQKFGEFRDGESQGTGYNRKAFPWFAQDTSVSQKAAQNELDSALAFRRQSRRHQPKLCDVDSEGEQITLCFHCLMPVGESNYTGKESKGRCVHGECMAQMMLQDAKERDDKRIQDETGKKLKNRAEYSIGWNVDQVPSNTLLAQQLEVSPAPQGLCCLVLDEATNSLRVAATQEPAAAVNLEYLLIALKVRMHACREPLFSLDPVDPENMETTMQAKRYEPSWLAGTSVGEVMFQADYFLKEMSMGEYTMPVVGMMSVFDWSEAEPLGRPWAGREWFVVKKAEMHLASDNTLIPHVKMGVEAREQVLTKDGLEDMPVTSPGHPLMKFADAFTKNFDLIAERKSVIFHLRELAKASVMAKFIFDSGLLLPVSWLEQANSIVDGVKPEVHSEIPQLWNMRGHSRIQVTDGKLLNTETGKWNNLMSLYGGVEFGLDRFELAQRHMLRPVGGAGGSTMTVGGAGGMQGMQLGPTGKPGFAPSRFQLTQRPAQPAPGAPEQPQGVDLNLDKFQLSAPDRFAGLQTSCSIELESPEAQCRLGQVFLESLQGDAQGFKRDDKELLKYVFNASLTDRLTEGDAFVPPDPNFKYVTRIRNLVNEENVIKERRRKRFSDASFVAGHAGPDFPKSWTSEFKVERGLSVGALQTALRTGLVQLQVDAGFKQSLLTDVLPSATAEFEESTEDGVVFRIYRLGCLEVRSIQEPQGPENLAAVFSMRGNGSSAWKAGAASKTKAQAADTEKVVRVRKYVEAIDAYSELTRSMNGKAAQPAREVESPWASLSLDHCQYYVVLETDASNVIVLEKLADGSAPSSVNPENLDDRNSLARLMYTAEKPEGAISVKEIKVFQAQSARKTVHGASPSERKLYAKSIFKVASGRARLVRRTPGKAVGKGKVQPQAVTIGERRTYSSTVRYGM